MKICIILIGAPGSGKTTYCRDHLNDYTRISQDDAGLTGHMEEFNKAIINYKNIVVDRMNFNRKQRERYIYPAMNNGYYIKIIHLDIDRDTCFNRIVNREDHPTIEKGDNITANKALDCFFNNFEPVDQFEYDEYERIIK